MEQFIRDPIGYIQGLSTEDVKKWIIAAALAIGGYFVANGGNVYTSYLSWVVFFLALVASTVPLAKNVMANRSMRNRSTHGQANGVMNATVVRDGTSDVAVSLISSDPLWSSLLLVFGLLPAVILAYIGWARGGLDSAIAGLGIGALLSAGSLYYLIFYVIGAEECQPTITQVVTAGRK